MGVGIIVTTVIFMILIFVHRNDRVQQNTVAPDTESKTVAEYENSAQKPEGTEAAEDMAPAAADTEHTEEVKPAAVDSETRIPEKKPEDVADQPEQTEPEQEEDPEQADQTEPENTNQTKPEDGQDTQDGHVQIEVRDGQFSDSVCKMLQDAGLIEDASDFNNYLVEHQYDHSIFPGTYDIPKGATYEEIAGLLTRK